MRGVGCSKGAETAANDAAREPRARGRAGDDEARKERHTYERSIVVIGVKGRLGRRILTHETARHRQSVGGRPRNTVRQGRHHGAEGRVIRVPLFLRTKGREEGDVKQAPSE